MKGLIIPKDYSPVLGVRETQKAIKFIKDTFQKELSRALGLERISAPLFVTKESGINDDLNGVERKVAFEAKELSGEIEIVQSLAKWKRTALKHYGFGVGEGLYTDMNAIRRDDDVDNVHSIFVDQWDWEKVIAREDRNSEYLKDTVKKIVGAVADTNDRAREAFPALSANISRDVFFITSEELLKLYPDLTPKDREKEITRLHGTVFIMQIGGELSDGKPHDGRAPDYDDWSLNGDIIVWDDVLGEQLELSSMGIRVDSDSLKEQLTKSGHGDRLRFDYHRAIAKDELPLTIGGGIGQSRICMFIMQKAHIGEVHCSVWPEEMRAECEKGGIALL